MPRLLQNSGRGGQSLGRDAVGAAAERAGAFDLLDLRLREAEDVAEDLLRVLAQERRAGDLGGRIRQLDWIADRDVLAPRRVVDLDERAGLVERAVLDDLLHGEDRPAWDVVLVEDLHGLELGLGHGPFLDRAEDLVEARQARLRLGVARVGLPLGAADHVADLLPDRRLGDEVDVCVGIALPALALQDAPGLAAARVVAGARHRVAEGDALAELAVFLERAMREPLLVAQLHPAEVEDAVLHGAGDALAAARLLALEQGGDDAEREVEARPRIADLSAGDERQPVAKAGRRGR